MPWYLEHAKPTIVNTSRFHRRPRQPRFLVQEVCKKPDDATSSMDAVAIVFRSGVCGPSTVLESRKLYLFPILMRQFGWDLIRFLAFSIGGLIALGTIAIQSPSIEFRLFGNSESGGHTWWRMKEFKKSAEIINYSVLHLGSSTTFRSINPESFQSNGIRSFNLGSSAQTIFNSKYILEWALRHEPNITAITLDIYPRLWNIEPTESTRDLFVNNPHVSDAQFQIMAWNSRDLYNKLLASYFGLKYAILHKFEIAQSDIDSYKRRGFTFSNRPPVISYLCDSSVYKMSQSNEDALNSIIQICRAKRINLIICFPPHLCDHNAALPESVRNADFVDGNHWPLAKVDTLYFDERHLRGVGAELYSIWFANQILSHLD